MTPPAERWGVLVLRVWVRGGDPATLRGHISQSLEVASQRYSIGMAQGIPEILAVVRTWLDSYLGHAARRDDPDHAAETDT